MLGAMFFLFEPSAIHFSLDPTPDGGCPLTPELKVFVLDFSDFGTFSPIYYAGVGAESGDEDHCAQLTIPEISTEFVVLVNEGDENANLNGAITWEVTPIIP